MRDRLQVLVIVGVGELENVRDFCDQIIASRKDGDGRISDPALTQSAKCYHHSKVNRSRELIFVVVGQPFHVLALGHRPFTAQHAIGNRKDITIGAAIIVAAQIGFSNVYGFLQDIQPICADAQAGMSLRISSVPYQREIASAIQR